MTTIETHGGVFRPLLPVLTAVVDEAKFHTTEDGVSVQAVDPANVFAIDFNAPPEGFEDYTTSGSPGVHGIPLGKLQKLLSFTRKGRGNDDGDPLRLEFGDREVDIMTTRKDTGVTRTSTLFPIDPDSIRAEPEFPTKEKVGVTTHASVDVSTFRDVVCAADDSGTAAHFTVEDSDLVIDSLTFGANGIEPAGESPEDTFVFEDVASPFDGGEVGGEFSESDGSLFSLDYLTDAVKAGHHSSMDHLALWFGDETPLYLKYEDTDSGAVAEYMLAPRIQSA
jgi:hypothetical protein